LPPSEDFVIHRQTQGKIVKRMKRSQRCHHLIRMEAEDDKNK
jgi:hypothetical protein